MNMDEYRLRPRAVAANQMRNGNWLVRDGARVEVYRPDEFETNFAKESDMKIKAPRYWQGGKPWGRELIAPGVTMARSGCVIASAAILVSMLTDKTVTPMDVLSACRTVKGALVDKNGRAPGSLMVWPVVLQHFGCACDDTIAATEGLEGVYDFDGRKVDANADLAGALAAAMVGGLAAVRVDHNGDGKGDHTIACVGRDDDGGFVCSDTALNTFITLDANLENPEVFWGPNQKRYRAVAIRAVYK